MPTKKELLSPPSSTSTSPQHNVVPLVDAMAHMAYSARDTARAANIYDMMLRDTDCGVILCLAGSLISAGLQKLFVDLIRNNMVDAIVSTGANIVDQDFFEALGFKPLHRRRRVQVRRRRRRPPRAHDRPHLRHLHRRGRAPHLRRHHRRRSPTPSSPAPTAPASSSARWAPTSQRQRHAPRSTAAADSIVLAAYEKNVPIFCPAFSDCSAGFGLVAHQHARQGKPIVSIDSAKDFYELTQLKIANPTTGLLMIGGGVPKNFAQDIVVAADILGVDAPMHKYAIQITVADARDGALSGSTLKEASSWGKVDLTYEQMVFSEATLALPLIAGYAFHKTGATPPAPASTWPKSSTRSPSPPKLPAYSGRHSHNFRCRRFSPDERRTCSPASPPDFACPQFVFRDLRHRLLYPLATYSSVQVDSPVNQLTLTLVAVPTLALASRHYPADVTDP